MKNICVVTGGGSGIGLATAKVMGKTSTVLLVGRTPSKLEGALQELTALGIEVKTFACDVGDRKAVHELAQFAASLGKVKAVIHAAGMSPHMASGESIFRANAIGTIYINEEFSEVMDANSCIIDVSSMSAYMMEADKLPVAVYPLSLKSATEFEAKLVEILGSIPESHRAAMGYIFSKHFVIWYAQQSACLYGGRGIRVLSVSPGTFETPMGDLEGEAAAKFAIDGALKRVGQPEEIAKLIAFIASDDASYLTGTDILCDGGAIAAMRKAALGL